MLLYGVRDPRLANSRLGTDVVEFFVDPADAVQLTVDWELDE
jgi:hypothetical protein